MPRRAESAQLRRYFYPWNPLQLSEVVDSGLRVRKNEVMFTLFRTIRRKLLWSAMFHRNLIVCDSTSEPIPEVIEQTLDQFAKQVDKIRGSASVEMFDVGEHWSEFGLNLDSTHPSVTYHPFPDDIVLLAQELSECSERLLEATENLSVLEAPNKMCQLLVIMVSADQLAMMSDPLNLPSFQNLLERLSRVRIYPLFFTEGIENFSTDFVKLFDVSVTFAGDSENVLSDEIYPDMKRGEYSIGQVYLGLMFDTMEDKLIPLHPLKYQKSRWAIENQAQMEAEDELYRQFLASLDDGM